MRNIGELKKAIAENKNIWLLPTDKSSRLAYYQESTSYNKPVLQIVKFESYDYKYKNIYITNSEEIKEDYVFVYGVVIKVMMFDKETLYFVNGTKARREDCKKIIITTDEDLIKDGVQAIDNEFLEWFVKNPSCEFVKVNPFCEKLTCQNKSCNVCCQELKYKIIIPKEELTDFLGRTTFDLLKQETLKEYAENYTKDGTTYFTEKTNVELGFIAGAKSDAAKEYWFNKFKNK